MITFAIHAMWIVDPIYKHLCGERKNGEGKVKNKKLICLIPPERANCPVFNAYDIFQNMLSN